MKPIIRILVISLLSISLTLALLLILQGKLPVVFAGGPWYVSPSGDNTTCLGWATACSTIQAAINKTSAGDTIYIGAGTYFEKLDNGGKALTLIGSGKETTILDGEGTGRVFYDSSDSTVITINIQDLTIQNGNMATNNGGGIYANHNLNLTNVDVLSSTTAYRGGGVYVVGNATIQSGRFENNWSSNSGPNECGGALVVKGTLNLNDTRFINNRAIRGGGAVYVANSTHLVGAYFDNNRSSGYLGGAIYADAPLNISSSQFINNRSYSGGGGIYSQDAVNVSNSFFKNNQATGTNASGGGLYVFEAPISITNTEFISNAAKAGSGLNVYNAGGVNLIQNSLFARNKNGLGSAIDFGGNGSSSINILYTTIAGPAIGSGSAIYVWNTVAGITDTIIYSYTTGIYLGASGSAYQDYTLFNNVSFQTQGTVGGGAHSQTGDPHFADPVHDNYHLTGSSKALDWGADIGITSDFDGQPRPLGGGFDVGFDEALLLYLPVIFR